jgi:arginyl-tRNA synthetase
LNGNTGPFIQYTYARIQSVWRKKLKAGSRFTAYSEPVKISKEEKDLIKTIYKYPAIISEAAATLSPALVANYAYEIARSFNHFYHNHIIIDEANPVASTFRWQLSGLTAAIIKKCMGLLGIEVPERM